MSYLLEIVGSVIIGGLILLIILNLNSNMSSSSGELSMDVRSQGNVTSLIEEIEYDLRKIGYRVSGSPAIITADTNAISFQYDIDNNGAPDTISYFLSDTTALSSTPNPRDKLLYRTINSSSIPLTSNLGVTAFRLWYYDDLGSLTVSPGQVRSIKFALTVESIYPYDNEYASTYIERLISPNNLR